MAVRDGKIFAPAAVLLALSWLLGGVCSGMTVTPKPGLGAPDFALEDLAGRTVRLSRLRGRNVLLLFGATWCPHCRSSLDTLARISDSVDDRLAVIFIAVGQSGAEVSDYFAGAVPSFVVLLDAQRRVADRFGIKRIPTGVFIDQAGIIQHMGRFSEEILWRLLAGERIDYPDKSRSGPRPHQRFTARAAAGRAGTQAGMQRYIVELHEYLGPAEKLTKALLNARRKGLEEATRRIGGRIVHNYGKLRNRIVVELPERTAGRLAELPGFKAFKKDRLVHVLLEDSAYQVKADYAWDNAITGQGVKVCVVDTGVDYTHPDLLNKVVAQYNAITGEEDAMDDQGHGTHVAGIIASQGMQYRGAAYDASIMAAKVLDSSGSGYASDVILGIEWCVTEGADVINLSLGEGAFSGTCDFDEMAKAVNAAVDAGVVVTCASGNDGTANSMVSPACASKAIAVGAVDKLDNIASYSDGGAELDLVAPGGDQLGGENFPEITSTYSTEVANNPLYCMYWISDECWDDWFTVAGNRYIRAVGTSMAAPHVAAAAALLLEENPHLSPAELKNLLEQNADDLGPPGRDDIYGWGRINIEKALENVPPEPAELSVVIAEPNASDLFAVNEQFDLETELECFGGDGCGDVTVHAQYCEGYDCNDFVDINAVTAVSSLDNNPNHLGVLSGYSVDTDVPVLFDAQTTLDVSERTYAKSLNPQLALVGGALPGEYGTGDLEPQDGVGAIGQDVEVLYDFELPPGTIKRIKVRLENYIVMHWLYPPYAGWYVYTSNAAGDNLHLIGDCIPTEGGGGEAQPADCWFISDDPNVLGDLAPGGTNHIKLVSHDVGDDGFGQDWLTFNDIEVFVEYEPDPNNDHVRRYYLKFDISGIGPAEDLTAARLKVTVAQPAAGAVAQLNLAENTLEPGDAARDIHEAQVPAYSQLLNPIKTFSCEQAGTVSLNVKNIVVEALLAAQGSLALQLTEAGNDQLVALAGAGSGTPPVLTVSQRSEQGSPPAGPPSGDPNNGPRPLVYETALSRDISEASYTKQDYPVSAAIGAAFSSRYSTGDLEPEDGIGATGQNVEKLYAFDLPPGNLEAFKVRLENYLVMHFDYPPFAGWYVYTSNAAGDELHLVGDCIPAEGGGGEPQPPDCWFTSAEPNVLADIVPGQTNYIKLVSHDVGENDWIFFNDIEAIAEYEIDPDNDNVGRYYAKFDISDLTAEMEIDSATLNVYVNGPGEGATAQVNVVDNTFDSSGAAGEIYEAPAAAYSMLSNPIKTFAADTAGPKKINVKTAVEEAVQNGQSHVALLITEQNEDALFSIDGGAGQNGPRLDVYLKSDRSSGTATWRITPRRHGDFTIRVLAENDVGAVSLSDAIVVNVYDPNLPVIHGIECMIDATWGPCSAVRYGQTIEKIRIVASDPQESPAVRLMVRNIPDDRTFVDEQLAYADGYFTHDTVLEILDSGQWVIEAVASDSDGNLQRESVTWNISWGSLESRLVGPVEPVAVAKGDSFTIQTEITCLDAECPQPQGSIVLNKAEQTVYDDGSAETFGSIGSTDWLLAVRFTPAHWPAQLRTARFYIWDTTTYPFELNIWDDNGPGGAPGSRLIPPRVVDPVVPSVPEPEVAWFDIDLSQDQIIIENGSFYIGWRQLEGTRDNQVGFDTHTDGVPSLLYKKNWAYAFNPSSWLEEWYNLNELCELGLAEYCGNLMIRAITSAPGAYSGPLPRTVGPAPFYAGSDHPQSCGDLDAGQSCLLSFQVRAVGAEGQWARFGAVAANKYSMAGTGALAARILAPRTPCLAANLDAAGRVDLGDLAVLGSQWLETTTPLPADIYIDQSIDYRDLAEIARYWLARCE